MHILMKYDRIQSINLYLQWYACSPIKEIKQEELCVKKLWIGIIIVLMLLTEGMVICRNLDYRYTATGSEQDIFPEYLTDIYRYEYDEEKSLFVQTGEDPQFYLQGMTTPSGGLCIRLKEAAQTAIPVYVFYAEEEPVYSERNSVHTEIAPGDTDCYIKLPLKSYANIRIDMDGSFGIDSISSYDGAMGRTPVWTGETTRAAGLALPVIVLFYFLLFYAHNSLRGDRTLGAYTKSILIGEPGGARDIPMDYLRVFAGVMIIAYHAVSNELTSTQEGSFWRLLFIMILTVGACGNVIFVMLSGRFLLSGRDRGERVLDFYLRRVSKIVMPFLTYYILILFLGQKISFSSPEGWGAGLKNILTGAPDVAPHFWIIYAILALYLAAPFLKVCVQNLSDSMLLSLTGVILAMNILSTYLPLAGISFGISTFLAGWEGVFILGYIMRKDAFAKHDRKIIIVACLVYVVSVGIMFRRYDMMNYIYACVPTTILMTCGIFAFVRRHGKWFGRDCALLRMCSKYSFSILMIHWYTLFAITEGRLHLSVMRGRIIGGLAATVVVAYLVSLVYALVIDNTLVVIVRVLFDKLVLRLRGGRKQHH